MKSTLYFLFLPWTKNVVFDFIGWALFRITMLLSARRVSRIWIVNGVP